MEGSPELLEHFFAALDVPRYQSLCQERGLLLGVMSAREQRRVLEALVPGLVTLLKQGEIDAADALIEELAINMTQLDSLAADPIERLEAEFSTAGVEACTDLLRALIPTP